MYTDIYNTKTLLTLSTLHSKIAKKQWDDAYVLLEALIIFQDGPGFVWPITILRALKSQGKLSPSHLPSIETILREITEWGDAISQLNKSSSYRFVTKAFGKRFFEHKTAADEDSHKQMRMENKMQERKEEDEEDDSCLDNPDIRTRILSEIVRKKDRKPWWFNTSTGEWDTRFNKDEDKEEEDFMINICERIPTSRSSIKVSCHCKWNLTKWSGRMKEPFLQITGSDDEDAQMS
ncbi:hypothetical protein C8J55DRAFT_487522 [Lentinula edodes]|uniref:Uncharacterized protein n=1 Tax=Lentinula lateritia TaxID=40482 RepID=A0A9W9AQ83_9AGAR|nr:hypothetical protein C8J55DRAFT_487522 [Lentinula edodes]